MKKSKINAIDKSYIIIPFKGDEDAATVEEYSIKLLSHNKFSGNNWRFDGTDEFLSNIDSLLSKKTDFYISEVFVANGKIYLEYKNRARQDQHGRVVCYWRDHLQLEFEKKRADSLEKNAYVFKFDIELPELAPHRRVSRENQVIHVCEYVYGTEINEFIIFCDGTISDLYDTFDEE